MLKALLVIVALLSLTACASQAPASLTPAGVRVWQANEVAVGLGTLQHAAIELNKVERCVDPGPVCAPLLSTANTRVVVDAVTDGLTTLREVPAGWQATGVAVLTRIDLRLDAAGHDKLSAYLSAARAIVAGL